MCEYYLRGYLLTEQITLLMRNTVDSAVSVALSEVYNEKNCIYQGVLFMGLNIELLDLFNQSLLGNYHNSKKKAG